MFPTSKIKWYVGIYGPNQARPGQYNPFQSSSTPTQASHGHLFAATIGPFKTKRAALWAAKHGKGNPHFQHVNDAEHLSKST